MYSHVNDQTGTNFIIMLGYDGYPELFCPAVKQHNIGADIFKQYFLLKIFFTS